MEAEGVLEAPDGRVTALVGNVLRPEAPLEISGHLSIVDAKSPGRRTEEARGGLYEAPAFCDGRGATLEVDRVNVLRVEIAIRRGDV